MIAFLKRQHLHLNEDLKKKRLPIGNLQFIILQNIDYVNYQLWRVEEA